MAKINKQDVYDYLTMIPKGCVVTYGMVAEYLGNKNWARTVGNILHENPDGTVYPCYKVVSSKGQLSEGYAFGGIGKQKELLMADGIEVVDDKVNLKRYCWKKIREESVKQKKKEKG